MKPLICPVPRKKQPLGQLHEGKQPHKSVHNSLARALAEQMQVLQQAQVTKPPWEQELVPMQEQWMQQKPQALTQSRCCNLQQERSP